MARRKKFKVSRQVTIDGDYDLQIIPLKANPREVDEIQGEIDYIYLEKMDKHSFCFRIRFGDDEELEFSIQSKMRKGPGIEIVER